MSEIFRRLWLGLFLILATSGFLLLSDRKQRVSGGPPRVAIFQFNSVALLDGGVQGIIDQLRENGYENGGKITLERFNGENDMATANSIAKELVSGKYDYVVTVSTNCLQAVANANRDGRTKHIFGVVADPLAAKVGINPNDPRDHPKQMTGIGSLFPAGELLESARQFYPQVKRLGLPWNPSQANSERFTVMARESAKKLGIELLEAAVDNTAAVGETVSSLVAREADAILILGDLTVALGIDSVVGEARKAKIPILTGMPDLIPHGALFANGVDYYVIGKQTGDLVVRALKGEDIAKIPILTEVPRTTVVNLPVLVGLKDPWRIPDAVIAHAQQVIR